eukprot:638042-Amphidinium_carterae.1
MHRCVSVPSDKDTLSSARAPSAPKKRLFGKCTEFVHHKQTDMKIHERAVQDDGDDATRGKGLMVLLSRHVEEHAA